MLLKQLKNSFLLLIPVNFKSIKQKKTKQKNKQTKTKKKKKLFRNLKKQTKQTSEVHQCCWCNEEAAFQKRNIWKKRKEKQKTKQKQH